MSDDDWAQNLAALKIGAPVDEVLKRLGKPDRIARQILFRRHLEVWTYRRQSLDVRIELNFRPGDGEVGRVQLLSTSSGKKP